MYVAIFEKSSASGSVRRLSGVSSGGIGKLVRSTTLKWGLGNRILHMFSEMSNILSYFRCLKVTGV